jgi:NIPSNAP
MIAEMRTYTVKDGMFDSYLELFNRQIVPNHRKHGIPVIGAWADRQKSQITWVRTFASREERKRKLDVYEVSPERDAVFPIAAYHVTHHEVKVLESVLNPTPEPDQAFLDSPIAVAARKAYDAIPKAESDAFKKSVAAPR